MKRLLKFSTIFLIFLYTTFVWAQGKPLLVDDFEGEEIKNSLGNRANIYVKAPSRIMMSKRNDIVNGKNSKVLLLRYDKRAEGGPYGTGGWCGYYTLLKSPGHLVAPQEQEVLGKAEGMTEDIYFDGGKYSAITFMVRGEVGGENFMVGLADRHWDKVGDSLKSEEIGKYLAAGKITKEWQRAVIPFDTYFLDYGRLSSIAICFEGDAFPNAEGQGIVYIDDIKLE